MQCKTKQSKRTKQRKAIRKRKREDNFLQDDDEIEEIIQDDEEDEDEADGDDDDDEYSGDVSFNMTGKEDPDFSPGIDSLKKTAASQPVRRSSR